MCEAVSVAYAFGVVFFFFKQKTAYEIPKRDWSSDVCSSDLWLVSARLQHLRTVLRGLARRIALAAGGLAGDGQAQNQQHNEHRDENEEQRLGDGDRSPRDAPKAQRARDQAQN